MSFIITHARIITPTGVIDEGWLHCQEGKIAAMGAGSGPPHPTQINAGGRLLLPGFIDLHVHGGAGYEAMDATPQALSQMGRFYAAHGVTSYLATTWTNSHQRILAALQNIKACMGPISGAMSGPTLIGAHLEGPYLNPSKSGAQNTDYIRRADPDEALQLLDLGVIKLLALAPEYEENHWLITECRQRGITVSAAHTAATYEQIISAAAMGITQATHTFNAMPGLHHREPGMIGAVLTTDSIKCELIADNVHVHPAAMKIVYLCKGAEGVILISDAIRSAGLPDGNYPIDDRVIQVKAGVARLDDGTLAGSTLTMNRALHHFMQATGAPIEALWQTSSLNAAKAIGIDDHTGSIEIGKDADLTLVDEALCVYTTIARGKIIYQKGG